MKYRVTGTILILVPILFNGLFFALASSFEYPDILRKPTDYILQHFVAGGSDLVALWYAFASTALLAIPLALLLYSIFVDEHPQMALATAIIGVISGLVQALGLFRWVFLVPFLSDSYTGATATAAARESAALVFEAAHRYLGVAVGEHMGYLFTGVWTILLSVMMLRSSVFSRWLGILGSVSAVGILVGLLEPAGWSDAGTINALSYVLWSVWLILMGVILIAASRRKTPGTFSPVK